MCYKIKVETFFFKLCLTLITFIVFNLNVWSNSMHPPSGPYGEYYRFVPAPPGKTPKCARPGQTYCEDIHEYPKYVIKNLLDKWCYDFNSLFLNEAPVEFNENTYKQSHKKRVQPVYGPPLHIPPPNFIGPYAEPYFLPKPSQIPYVTNDIGNGFLPPAPNAISNYSKIQTGPGGSKLFDPINNYLQYSNSYGPPQYYNSIQYSAFNNQPDPTAQYWAKLPAHPRSKRSPFKRKWPYKFRPKTQTFKEYINYKPPRKANYTLNDNTEHNITTDVLSRQKRHFLSLVNDIKGNKGKNLREKRQAPNQGTLCNVRTQFIAPKAALNNQGNWKYVVNIEDSQYTQLVQSVTCANQQQSCNQICSLPAGYASRCEQRYVQRRLVALQETGQQLESDLFWLPSCCVCTISLNN